MKRRLVQSSLPVHDLKRALHNQTVQPAQPWSSLLTIRPSGDAVCLEDASNGRRECRAPEDVAREIIDGALTAASSHGDLGVAGMEWVEMGWRPSLEYFLWSERSEDTSPTRRVRTKPEVAPTGREWTWSAGADAPVDGELSVGDLLMGRRTTRVFRPEVLDAASFARLLERARTPICQVDSEGQSSIELYLIAYGIESIDAGVWRVNMESRSANWLIIGDEANRRKVSRIMCGMPAALTAAGTFVFVVNLGLRMETFPYERALRELYVDVARLAHWIILAAESLGIGCLITPATNDVDLARLLELREGTSPIYTLTFGWRKRLRPANS